MKAGIKEHRTHQNYKNTIITHSKTEHRNKQKKTQKEKKQWSSLIIFGSIDYKTIAKSRSACHKRFTFFSGTEMNKEHPLEVGVTGSVDNYFHLTHY